MGQENLTLHIVEGTTVIGAEEYRGGTFSYVEFPDSLKEIGEEAFAGCAQIKWLKFPFGLAKIGAGAFKDCGSLKEVFIPESVEEIGEEAFTEFGLIYCARWERGEGWFMEHTELPCDDDEDVDIGEQALFCHEYRTWCGNFSYRLTWDEFMASAVSYKVDPYRKVLWGRKERYVHIIDNQFYYDILSDIKGLGHENLKAGKIPNINYFMKELQDVLREKMENTFCTERDIQQVAGIYMEAVVNPLMLPNHEEEALFIYWGINHYTGQLMELYALCEKIAGAYQNVTEEKCKTAKVLLECDGEWKEIIDLLEHVEFPYTKLAALLRLYYEKVRPELEDEIFRTYDSLFLKERGEIGEALLSGERQDKEKRLEEEGERCFQQAVDLVKEKDYDAAGGLFRRAAVCGHTAGKYNFGISVINGEGCEKNLMEGCYWYQRAAEEGDARAMMNLAICYRNGHGVLQSGKKMVYWYAKAAHEFLPEAVYNLGLTLKHEEVIPGNSSLGRSLIKASDDLEHEAAQKFVVEVTETLFDILQE